jgi:mono/diheme cytochrome c family protein
MPQFQWSAQELTDMTTFLLGSLEPQIPAALRYTPDERGQAIRDGWWVVKKFNCQGCHPFRPGDVPAFAKLPWFQDPKLLRDRVLPPTLVGEGFRVRPEWLAAFLKDPSHGGGTARPKSVRRHLGVRMPTFHLSEDDIARLVRFFQAMADQPFVHQPQTLPPLTDAERAVAEKMWTQANCMQCHVADGIKPEPDAETKAPDLSYAPERLRPDWMVRWVREPMAMQPLTSMLKVFKEDPASGRWVYDGVPEFEKEHTGDHVELIVRYVLSLGGGARR